jgi:hypothetical protein
MWYNLIRDTGYWILAVYIEQDREFSAEFEYIVVQIM